MGSQRRRWADRESTSSSHNWEATNHYASSTYYDQNPQKYDGYDGQYAYPGWYAQPNEYWDGHGRAPYYSHPDSNQGGPSYSQCYADDVHSYPHPRESDNYPQAPLQPPPASASTSTHYSSAYQDVTYFAPPDGYQRRPYRATVTLSDGEDSFGKAPSSQRQYSTHGREQKRMSYLRLKPRQEYHSRTCEPPAHYPPQQRSPLPLPLLVLDLNGTLVCRDARGKHGAADRSRKPVLRPYLKSFLQYCLGVQAPNGTEENHLDAWDAWQHDSRQKQKTVEHTSLPHGAHFWRSSKEPTVLKGASFRLLLWSSAQPQNVDLMAKAILCPAQAEQLLRVYARDTLVTKRLFFHKAPSVKDLEILWAALNINDQSREAERRLLAEARNIEDTQSPDEDDYGRMRTGRGAAEIAARQAQANVILPKVQADGTIEDGRGFGQHNTLLLDDSVDKARLQPFNHILLPEFDRGRALDVIRASRKGRDSEGEENASNRSRSSSPTSPKQHRPIDNVLLQVVGVLEHARYQKNVSSWIRFGGLGDFGGMREQHPYYLDEGEDLQVSDKIIEEAISYFSSSASESDLLPRLRMPTEERTPAFWAEEGERALHRHGIPLQQF